MASEASRPALHEQRVCGARPWRRIASETSPAVLHEQRVAPGSPAAAQNQRHLHTRRSRAHRPAGAAQVSISAIVVQRPCAGRPRQPMPRGLPAQGDSPPTVLRYTRNRSVLTVGCGSPNARRRFRLAPPSPAIGIAALYDSSRTNSICCHNAPTSASEPRVLRQQGLSSLGCHVSQYATSRLFS